MGVEIFKLYIFVIMNIYEVYLDYYIDCSEYV